MKFCISTPIRFSFVLLLSALLVSGCSSSSDSNSGESQTVADVSEPSADSVIPNDGTSGNANETEVVTLGGTTDGTQTGSTGSAEESTTESGDESISDLELPDSSNPVVVDPLIQNRILVTFDISVPAYQSNELHLEVVWGDLNLTAGWVGDEIWAVSGEFPTETEELLTVTFFDNNGAIELASFSQTFRTGSNATDAFQIFANQFNVDQFDDDGDGVNNIDELIAGNDPTIDEDSLLEIRDIFRPRNRGIAVTESFESLLTEERPISTTTQEPLFTSGTIDTDIQIDLNGNGTLTSNNLWSCTHDRVSGIRTRVGNAITWETTRSQFDCDFWLRGSITNTVTVIDEDTRTFVETRGATRSGSFTNNWHISTNLVGKLVEGTSLCKPVSGTFSEDFTSNGGNPRGRFITNVSKEADDPYWRVEVQRTEFVFFPSFGEVYVETTEYFVRELILGRDSTSENQELFICDFVDI